MPELPEVEALVRFLDDRATGRAVVAADVAQIAALKTFDPPVTALVGRTVTGARRHGKWLDLVLAAAAPDDELHLVFHLARGGWLRWSEKAPTTPVRPRLGGGGGGKVAALALRVRFDDGSGFDLTEAGTRKRLAVHVVRRPEEVRAIETLGVEPLDPAFTPDVLAGLMAARNQQVKGLLRDQSSVAGIGNAYSDDILHAARTSPFKLTRSFTPDEVARVHAAVGEVLAQAVAASSGKPAAELKDAKRAGMRVHGRTGLPCPVCGDTVREVSFADRSLQYCATCQTGGQVLADRRMSRLLR
ncbi:Fpg/Nei family DNA glycosylase [Cellulosimicrobium marinum]|uniref:Fpg/Nei family DNA glycosylase n=1 Tax=Cellulosimicrobium marinum TaxID=1638992 RepID=UPI001E3E9EF8|nr:DNA-formamidopyrimidine glycosylase family protein [Cellulosimicrobium marinum]MCB7137703.1 Fpg/Nei family DNA glycosylase [Cellulosimicrobium marinum]